MQHGTQDAKTNGANKNSSLKKARNGTCFFSSSIEAIAVATTELFGRQATKAAHLLRAYRTEMSARWSQ